MFGTDLRARLHAQDGFSLIELLVVIIIVGLLAAIAVPSMVSQRGKAQDVEAKAAARSAATAMEAFRTDRGNYAADVAALQAIEPVLRDARGLQVAGADDTFEVSALSANGARFSIARETSGRVTRYCTPAGQGGCRAGNSW